MEQVSSGTVDAFLIRRTDAMSVVARLHCAEAPG